MGAVSILTRIGVLPEEIRSYKQAVDEQNDEERVLCDMALDVVKSVRACRRFDKYGKDSDLYQLEIRKAALILLGRRATAAFARAHAHFTRPSARMKPSGMRCALMGKFKTARCVDAP